MPSLNVKSSTIVHFCSLQWIGACLFFFFEIATSTRFDYWLGYTTAEWLGTLPGLAIFVAMFSLFSAPLALILFVLTRKLIGIRIVSTVATAMVAIGLAYLFAGMQSGFLPAMTVRAGFMTAGILGILGLLMFREGLIVGPLVGITAGVPSALALIHVLEATLFDFDRGQDTTLRVATGWLIGLAVAGVLLGIARAKYKTIGTVSLACVALIAALAPVGVYAEARFAGGAIPPTGPNVLLLTADTLRADYMSAYGGPAETPNIDRLASTGTIFERHYSLSPWTVPSFCGLFSSKYPPSLSPNVSSAERSEQLALYERLGTYWQGPDERSLVNSLGNERGYTTGAIVGNAAMMNHAWLLDDFDSSLVMFPFMTYQQGLFGNQPWLRAVVGKVFPAILRPRPYDYTRAITEHSNAFLKFRTKGSFFLWVHYMDPHSPNYPPDRFRTDKDTDKFFPMVGSIPHIFPNPEAAPSLINASEEDQAYVRQTYRDEIRYIDDAVGNVLDTLASEGLSDDTYVIFSSDHGEELWDHGQYGHGFTMYEEMIRVPLIVTGEDIAVQRIADPVSAIDLIPSLAELLGEEKDAQWRGTSLAKQLRGEPANQPKRSIFVQATGVLPLPPEPLQSVTMGRYKLIRGLGTNTVRLFDLEQDPAEKRDIAFENPQVVDACSKELDGWSTSFPATLDLFSSDSFDLQPMDETIEALRGMGYLD